MIQFQRYGESLRVVIEANLEGGEARPIVLDMECGSDLLAMTLRHYLKEKMQGELSRIRMEAYAEGWKHAKAKTAKRKTFWGWWR